MNLPFFLDSKILLYLFLAFSVFEFTLIDELQVLKNALYIFILIPSIYLVITTKDNFGNGIISSNKSFFYLFLLMFIIAIVLVIVDLKSFDDIIEITKHSLYLFGFCCFCFIIYKQSYILALTLFLICSVSFLVTIFFNITTVNYLNSQRLISYSAVGSAPILADIIGCYGIYLFINSIRNHKYLLATVFFLSSMVMIVFLQGRAVILALFLSGIIWILTDKVERKVKTIIVMIILAILVISALFVYNVIGIEFITEMQGRSDGGRIKIWQELLLRLDSCGYLLGCGYDADPSSTIKISGINMYFPYFHSIYLSTFYFSGVIGLLVFIYFLLFVSVRGFKNNSIWFYVLVTSLITLFFEGNKLITNLNFSWFLLWMPIFLCYITANNSLERDD